MKQYLEIGRIVTTHGLRGDVKVVPWCDAAEFLCEFDELYLDNGRKALEITRANVQKNSVLMHIKGVDTVEAAEKLRNQILYMDRDMVELDEGTYFIQDLIGLTVKDVDHPEICYGTIQDVMETGANDVYDIRDEKGESKLIPAIPDVVVETDLENGIMWIRPLEGLFDAD